MEGLRYAAEVAKALSDPGRMTIAVALDGAGELCVCQLVELLGLSFPTVSRHLSALERAGLVETERKGRWTHCRLSRGGVPEAAVEWLKSAIPKREVKEILKRVKGSEECVSAYKGRRGEG